VIYVDHDVNDGGLTVTKDCHTCRHRFTTCDRTAFVCVNCSTKGAGPATGPTDYEVAVALQALYRRAYAADRPHGKHSQLVLIATLNALTFEVLGVNDLTDLYFALPPMEDH